jgi:hypothetical protein
LKGSTSLLGEAHFRGRIKATWFRRGFFILTGLALCDI